MKTNIISVIGLSFACLAATVLLSGAPLRVHLVDALSLLIAFTIPAAHITEFKDIKKKWRKIIIYWFAGTLVWFFVTPIVIVKAEIDIERLTTLIPASFIGLIVFISLHLIILKIITKDKRTKNTAEHANQPDAE